MADIKTEKQKVQEKEAKSEKRDTNRETQLLHGNENQFGIYQLKDTEDTMDIQFMPMDYLERKGIAVARDNYDLIYTAPLKEGMSLEDIYTKFNTDHPKDFTGHSLSVSDVVVFHQNGENSSHYVDSFGYREVPEFVQEFSMSAEISEEKTQGGADKVSYYVIEDLSTWAENSPEKSRLERFDSLTKAMKKFAEYRAKDMEYSDDKARATLGVSVGGIEFDVLHVREGKNYLVHDFMQIKAAQESKQFLKDLQTIHDVIGFDKIRIHREMTPEEVKDFVKQRFQYQLEKGGLEDISPYMDRFDALYEQGKMDNLMPTANQKRVIDIQNVSEWENPYLEQREPEQLAFSIADRYVSIQICEDGYDYSIFDENYRLLDGGVYDNPEISIKAALHDIVEDLKEPQYNPETEQYYHTEVQGKVGTSDELLPVDYDELMEKAESVEREQLAEGIRVELPEVEESSIIADFKVKTEELFHGINGQTQEEVEQTIWAYTRSKIDEYEIDAELVDVVVSGSRCRGLEQEGSDLDVVVEYKGRESEDDLFHIFHEDGLMIGGIKVDINPITEGKTGTLETYLPTAEAYLAEKRAAMQKESEPEIRNEEAATIVTFFVAECMEFHSLGEFHEGIESVDEALSIFHQIPPGRMGGIPSVGINIHTEGTETYEDIEMDILSGKVINLEILDHVPDITHNPKAMELIEELIEKLPDREVRGSLEKWQAALLAEEIDQFSYDYNTDQYKDTVTDREAQVASITEDIKSGNIQYLNDFLHAVISEGVREGITDIFGEGMKMENSGAIQATRKAKELLDKLSEYKPLAKVEELEEANYNMIDNVWNNEKPKKEEKRSPGRISIKEKLAEKKVVIENRDKDQRISPEKEAEKKSQREM